MLTYERAHERLLHDPVSGDLIWKMDHWKKVKAGNIAGDRYRNGYRRVCIDSKEYLAHRVVWLMAHGEWPPREVDHINGIRDDNRLSNLRLAASSENKQNAGLRSDNKSGLTGVTWVPTRGKWRADIHLSRKQYCLGFFDTVDEAAAARTKAKAELHKFQPVARAA
jgi:hypothetical protein